MTDPGGTAPQPGGVPLSHRRVLLIAAPIVLSNITVPLLGAVDTAIIGHLGRAAPIGAVGMGAVILLTIYWIFGFLRMGTTGLVAQAHGAGQPTGLHLVRALALGLCSGGLLVLLQYPIFEAAFALSPATPEVEGLARQYLGIRIWGAPATIALYAVNGWLIGVERTRQVLLLQLLIGLVNLLVSLWLVFGLDLGVRGVAAGTLVAEWTGLAFGLWLARGALAEGWDRAGLGDRAALLRLARVNSDIMIRSVLLQGCFTVFMFYGAGLGDATLAANQVLLQFLEVTAFALDGFAFAAETLIGQAVGARRPAAVRRAAIMASQWAVAASILLGLAIWLSGPAVIDALTTAPDVREAAKAGLPWLAIAPVIGVAAWMLDGIFIGATLTAEMRRAVMASVAIYAVALLALPPALGNHGLWAALTILNISRGLFMGRLYPAVERAAAAGR